MNTMTETPTLSTPAAAQPEHIGLAERAMNVSLHLSAWGGYRLDRTTTQEVLAERQAASDAGRFEKQLVPPKALEPVRKAHSKARRRHYNLTLPWDEGVRILSAEAFFDYSAAMREERMACDLVHQAFIAAYPQYISEAPKRMGPRMFNALDFPLDIKDKFSFKLVVLPVPNKDDFRVKLGDELQGRLRESIENTVTERYADAQKNLWTRVLDATQHFAATMQKEKPVFRASTLEHVAELAELAPKLTLTPDPELSSICSDLRNIVKDVDVQSLRDSATLRRTLGDRAAAVAATIEAAMTRSP